MTKIIETRTNRNGHKVRLQQRGGKFDVIINSTGITWRYLVKGATEADARAQFDYSAM